jgi:hypothetical protein
MLSLTISERLARLNRDPSTKLGDALTLLARHRVDLLVVGGVACVLQGAPIAAADLDIMPRQTPDNVERLWTALFALDAGYRDGLGKCSDRIAQPSLGLVIICPLRTARSTSCPVWTTKRATTIWSRTARASCSPATPSTSSACPG